MTQAEWIRSQERVAAKLNGRRHRLRSVGKPDVESEVHTAEVRQRHELPPWIVSALERARRLAGDDHLGIAVLTEKGTEAGMVVIDLEDFARWYV